MLIRSSPNSLVQTLFPDSPNRDFETNHHFPTKLSSIHAGHHRHLSLCTFSCDSSPSYLSPSGSSESNPKPNSLSRKSFRRARSEGNLGGLASNPFDLEECNCKFQTFNRSLHKQSKSMLHTAPSFSIYTSEDGIKEEPERENDGCLERSVTIGENIEAMGSGEFSFGKKSMDLIEENDDDDDDEEQVLNEFQDLGIDQEQVLEPASPPMHLATGLGVGGGGGSEFAPASFSEGGNAEEYFKRMLGQDPSNPLFLRNYAQLLKCKGDLFGAEEYLFRATLADPEDGEILSLYAKLVWELHHDQDRALNYFERAAEAAPEDSHVLAAYASFLWEIEEDKEEHFSGNGYSQVEEGKALSRLENSTSEEEKEPISPFCSASGLGIDEGMTVNAGEWGNINEDHYRKMVDENPSNPLFLRNYAQFLYQTKGDLGGAEEFYSRAILADPGDGEIISQYAQLVWQLHRDRDKASSYFERAVQAAPDDCDVLAVYASFLWEVDEDEEEEDTAQQDHIQGPLPAGEITLS